MRTAIYSLLVVVLGLISEALTSITPRSSNPMNYTLGPKDKVSLYMWDLFDLSKSKSPSFQVKSGNANIYNYTVSFTDINLSDYGVTLSAVHQMIDLGNGVVGLIFNNKSFMWMPFSKDGKAFGQPVIY